ncbi:MAG TPA: YIP1 family protein [Firmicutes bacterium]|nr:YIP1 family protein [Bacillota bacterium]
MAINEMEPTNGNTRKAHRGVIERLLTILVDPAGIFKDIIEKPDFMGPMTIIVITAALSMPSTAYTLQQIPEMAPGQAQNIPINATASALIGSISSLIALAIWWPIRAAIFLGIGNIFKAKLDFKQSLAVSGYLNYPSLLSGLVSAITIWSAGRPVTPGLGMALSFSELSTPRGVLLSNLNIFALMYIFLSVFGLSELWRISRAKGLIATIIMWSAVLGIQVAIAGLTAGLRGIAQ